jgi:beta-glucanase (GH16 family)
MKTFVTLSICFGLCQPLVAQTDTSRHWKLAWSDEFNYSGLPDPKKWSYEEGFVRNKEPQYYTVRRKENARVENGCLVIEARKETYPNGAYRQGSTEPREAQYTSASLITLGKEDMLYGRVEVRARLPRGRGGWPAIWMLGIDRQWLPWPLAGEIDIMEFLGRDSAKVYSTLHYADSTKKTINKGGILDSVRPADGFHVYALQWYPDRFEFFYDDNKFFTFDISHAGAWQDTFRKKFYLLLNLALGHTGSWAGPFSEDELPFRYYIDYVRVYKETDN